MAIVASLAALFAVLALGIQVMLVLSRSGILSRQCAHPLKEEKKSHKTLFSSSYVEPFDTDSEDDDGSISPSPTVQALARPPSQLAYELRPSPGKGIGAFATRLIPRHTRVLVEPPQFVVVPPEPTPSSATSPSSIGSSIPSTSTSVLSRIRDSFNSLTPAEKSIYDSCHEHRFPGEPDSGRLFYIFRSNAFSIVPVDVLDSGRWGTRWGMFPRMARINHSCQPNVANLWVPSGFDNETDGVDATRGHHVVWTLRDIAPGEELLISYVNILQDTKARQLSLDQFGFKCDCPICCETLNGNTILDEQRVHIGSLLRQVQDFVINSEGSQSTPGRINSHVEDLETVVRALNGDDSGLSGYLPRAYRLAAALGRLVVDYGDIGADMVRIESWEADEQALVHSILSTDGG